MTVLVVLLSLAVAVLAVIVFGLLRTHAEILRALDRLGVSLDEEPPASGPRPSALASGTGSGEAPGRQARDIVGVSPGGGPTKVSVTDVAHFTLLAFLSPGCRTCKGFWEAFADPELELPGVGTRLVIVGQDPAHDSESAFTALVPPGLKAVMSTAAWHDYDVGGSPYLALVDGSSNRVVGAGSATSWEQMSGLLGQARGDDAATAPRRRGGDDAATAPRRRGGDDAATAPRRRGRASGRRRAQRADEALQAAGIGPGDPSLNPDRRFGRTDDRVHEEGNGEATGNGSRRSQTTSER